MDAAAPVPLHDALTARREVIADRWYRAVAHTGFAPLGGPEVRARLLALTNRAIAALLAEPFEPAEARAIGAALAALHYLDPAALESTLVVLGGELLADVPPAALPLFSPRLTTLFGALARGYYAAARATILAEQEAARIPLLAEQRRIEVALRASEARLLAVVTNSPVMIFAIDREGIFTLAEGKGLAALDLTPAAVVGHSAFDLFAGVPMLVADVRRALAGEKRAAIATLGAVVVEAWHEPVRDDADAVIGVIGVAFDVTARALAEAALRAGEERLRAVVTSAPVILFTLDRAGVVTFAAGQGLAALGQVPGGLIGRAILAGGSTVPGVPENVRRALAGEAFGTQVVVGEVIFEARYAPLRDEAGAVAGVIGVATDVTARATAETERDEARRLLAVEREAERLQIAWALHDGPVQQLLGVRHHLAAVGRRLTHKDRSGEIALVIAVIEGELVAVARELRGLIGTLRPMGLEEWGLSRALAEHVARLQHAGERMGPTITLTLDPAAGALPLPVAGTLLRVAQEALRNALRHAGAGRIDVRLTVEADDVALIVADDGRGMHIPTRLGTLARDGHFGLVGLEEEVSLARGRFMVESWPGTGTTVTARLPRIMQEGDDDLGG